MAAYYAERDKYPRFIGEYGYVKGEGYVTKASVTLLNERGLMIKEGKIVRIK